MISLPSFALEEIRLSGKMWVEVDGRCKRDGYDYTTGDSIFKYSFDKTRIKFLKIINFEKISDFDIVLNRCTTREYKEERKTNPHDLCFHIKSKGDNRKEAYIICPPYNDFNAIYKSILASLEQHYFKDSKKLLASKHQDFLKLRELHPFIDTVSHMADYYQFKPFLDNLSNNEKNLLWQNYQAVLDNRYPGIISPGVSYKKMERIVEDGSATISKCAVWSLHPQNRVDGSSAAADECIIKTVRIDAGSFEDAKAVIKEARILRHLGKHDTIIGLKDYNIFSSKEGSNNSVYLVMERGGDNLKDFIEKNRYLHARDYYWITLRLLGGLSYMHYKQIYHLDIKPSNILVRGGGRDPVEVKIIDFGASRESLFLDNETDKKAYSRVGTDEWNVTEELEEGIDFEKNDAYSAALTLLNTLFAHRYNIPFSARNSGSRYLPDFWINYIKNETVRERLEEDSLYNLLGLLVAMIMPQDQRITAGRAYHLLSTRWGGWFPPLNKQPAQQQFFPFK